MKKQKWIKIVLYVIILAVILQAGLVAYSMVGNLIGMDQTESLPQEESSPNPSPEPASQGGENEISQEVLDLIYQADPAHYDTNVANYRSLLTDLHVHKKYQDEIERLLRSGNPIEHIMIAYEFLYKEYGTMQELGAMVSDRQAGIAWDKVFADYHAAAGQFTPRTFASGQLEKWMSTGSLTADDIMIADRVSQKLSAKMEDIMKKREQGTNWREINGEYLILNAEETLPHVPVTKDQLARYVKATALSEQKVVEAMVLADRLHMDQNRVMEEYGKGKTQEEITAMCYREKYEAGITE